MCELVFCFIRGIPWGQVYFWNSVFKCPEIRPKIPGIQPEIPPFREIPVIREIWPKISAIRLKNLEIRRKIPEILEIQREIPEIWPENLQIRPEIPEIWPDIHETRL